MKQEEKPLEHRMIGPYQVIKSLGRGGMGEVFLVYDQKCQRKIALKKILPGLSTHKTIKERFLREAKFASKLSHPSIVPIFSIDDSNEIYYTMPFIEGENLKDILKSTLEKEKKGLSPHEIGISIPTLIRIFLSVCQAISYAYSKGILHRDLKPDNIMVGKFGEVLLLDWGIATNVDEEEPESEETPVSIHKENNLTKPGKVLGTVNFLAPERALKHKATIQSEIYSLGVILYQILTLRLPFYRKNLEHFRKILHLETIEPPEEVAPYRDIPKQLSTITMKCLKSKPEERYSSLSDLIFDLENFMQGKPEWGLAATLNINHKHNWEFQENILLSKQMAISNILESLEWYGLMISKHPFSGNLRIEFHLYLPDKSEGLGILMCIPEASDRKTLEDGYCLWIDPLSHENIVLYRSNAEILSISNSGIFSNYENHICIQKIENSVQVFINGSLKLSYTSHIPIVGTHIGILYKSPDFQISPLSIFNGTHALMINCLSVPDAFLASKNFDQALIEYQKIFNSFQDRREGLEALFRAGFTLLEKGKRSKDAQEKEKLFTKAFDEFEKLRTTTAAPLEYLGKSLVYYALSDSEEEIKCLELALRKFPSHPLLSILKEQIIFRLHESAKEDKISAYKLLLICLQHMQEIFNSPTHQKLLDNLQAHWPILPFISQKIYFSNPKSKFIHLSIQLAFWLNNPLVLLEIEQTLDKLLEESKAIVINLFFAMLYLYQEGFAKRILEENKDLLLDQTPPYFHYFLFQDFLNPTPSIDCLNAFISTLESPISFHKLRIFYFFLEKSYEEDAQINTSSYIEKLRKSTEHSRDLYSLKVSDLKNTLFQADIHRAETILSQFSEKELNDPRSILHFLYVAYLYKKYGEDKALSMLSFSSKDSIFQITRYYKERQHSQMFFYEKIEMYKKLLFFNKLIGNQEKYIEYNKKLKSLIQEQKEQF
jgi:serine/threonine-protein kinase